MFEPGHGALDACTPALALCKRFGLLGLSSLIRLAPCGRVLPPPLCASGALGARTALLHRTDRTQRQIKTPFSPCRADAGPHGWVPLRTREHTANRGKLAI